MEIPQDNIQPAQNLEGLLDTALTALEAKAVLAVRRLEEQRQEAQKVLDNVPKERLGGPMGLRVGSRISGVMAARGRNPAAIALSRGRRLGHIDQSGYAIMKLYAGRKEPRSRVFSFEDKPRDTHELIAAVRAALCGIIFALDEYPSQFLEETGRFDDQDFFKEAQESALGKEFLPQEITDLIQYITALVGPVALNFVEQQNNRVHPRNPSEALMQKIMDIISKDGKMSNDLPTRLKMGGALQDNVILALRRLLEQGKIARIYRTSTSNRCIYVMPQRVKKLLQEGKIQSRGEKGYDYNFVMGEAPSNL